MPRPDLIMFATDSLIVAVGATLGLRLVLAGHRDGRRTLTLAGLGLLAIAMAALLGGSGHGLDSVLSPAARLAVRQGVRVLLVLAGLALVAALARAVLAAAARRVVVILALTKALFAIGAALALGGWGPSEVDATLSLAGLLALAAYGARRGRFPGAGAGLGALGAGLAGILLRRAGVDLPPWLSNDDVFHLVACAALGLVYLAARDLRDRD